MAVSEEDGFVFAIQTFRAEVKNPCCTHEIFSETFSRLFPTAFRRVWDFIVLHLIRRDPTVFKYMPQSSSKAFVRRAVLVDKVPMNVLHFAQIDQSCLGEIVQEQLRRHGMTPFGRLWWDPSGRVVVIRYGHAKRNPWTAWNTFVEMIKKEFDEILKELAAEGRQWRSPNGVLVLLPPILHEKYRQLIWRRSVQELFPTSVVLETRNVERLQEVSLTLTTKQRPPEHSCFPMRPVVSGVSDFFLDQYFENFYVETFTGFNLKWVDRVVHRKKTVSESGRLFLRDAVSDFESSSLHFRATPTPSEASDLREPAEVGPRTIFLSDHV